MCLNVLLYVVIYCNIFWCIVINTSILMLSFVFREQLFWGQKFRIFLEKAIIDLKHHFWHFLTEDFYIFSFLTFIVKKILVLISLPFFVIVLVLILITWTCNMWLSGLILCQCVIISHILLLYFINIKDNTYSLHFSQWQWTHTVSTVPNDDDVITV